MPMRESVAAYDKAGLNAKYHWLDRDTAKKNLAALLKQLEVAGAEAHLCIRPGLNEAGAVTLWMYVSNGADNPQVQDGDNGFDQSHPCPPFCT